MDKMDRRRFVITGAAAGIGVKLAAQDVVGAAPAAQLRLLTAAPGPRVPANFVGLSYETQELSNPDFFSPRNTGLVARLRELAPQGVLRLGGNTSDYAFWKPTPQSVPPPRPPRPFRVGEPPPELSYNVTPEAVRNLRGFLDATGWTCLYGINLGTNTPEIAADEAAFVAKTLGEKLDYIQIGNEADLFSTTVRDPKTWNADAFFDNWLQFANAIRARVRGARFGMPDFASHLEWYAEIVTRLLALEDAPQIAALTHHYYFTGPPSNPRATVERLLQPDANVDRLYNLVHEATVRLDQSGRSRAVYRMAEGNTCYRGGKPGLSDVFAAALWSADYFLKLASMGYAGVNLHGGTGQFVAVGLGGKLPGEELMPDASVPHPRPFYTPVAEIEGKYKMEPVAHGMMFARRFAGATMVPVDFGPGAVNATAYAAKHPDGREIVAIINKDATQNLQLALPGWRVSERLTGASLQANEAQLTAADEASARGTVRVPAASAALLAWAGGRDQFGSR